MLTSVLKEKTCPVCRNLFMPGRPLQAVCGPKCAMKKVREDRAQERVQTRERKQACKRIRDLVAEAQTAFNAYIRERDRDQPCISCGETNPPMKPGGQWDAGHFMSRGAYPELRFNEDNCHKQCKSCNGGGGRFAHKARTVAEDYERNLIERIGEDRFYRLKEGPHDLEKLTRDELIEKAATYRRKLRELKAWRAA